MSAFQDWVETTLGELALSMQNGIYRPASVYSDTGVPCLRMYNILEGGVVWRDIKHMTLTPEEVQQFGLVPGDILVNRVNSRELVGKAAVIPSGLGPCVFESKNIRVRVDQRLVSPRYLNYLLLLAGSRYFAHNAQQTVGMASVNQTQLAAFPVPLAPLPEQDRIVAEIEKQFTRVDAAIAALKRVQANLKRYRAAVLKAAVRGRLVPTEAELAMREGRGYESGRQLLDRMVGAREGPLHVGDGRYRELPGELREGWAVSTFGDLTHNHDGTRVPVRAVDRAHRAGPYPYYGASGIIDHVDSFLFDGDFLLVAEDGANLLSRSTPVAFEARGRFWVNNHAHVVQPKDGVVLQYLTLVINATNLQFFVTGSAQPKLTQRSVNEIPVPVPPLAEQRRIVAEAERRFSVIDELAEEVDTSLRRTVAFRGAVLKAAYAGRLVPRQSTDEPAAILLEKIRATRSAPEAQTPSFRRATRSRRGRAAGGSPLLQES